MLSCKLLYNLADRSDCVARAILDHAIVGLIPVQNPDGRAHDTRYNGYSFDMNRDVLVGTQPEVAGRLKLLWKYPPQLFVDEHENSGTGYFFPPDADPIYHETPAGLYEEVEQLYGPANEAAFQANGWSYETSDSGYDFFAQVYGDTVPTTQMGAVGMTFEQGDETAYPARVLHQFTSALTTLFTAATHHEKVLRTWRARPSSRRRTRVSSASCSRTRSTTPATICCHPCPTARSAATSCSANSAATPGAWSAGCRPPTSSSSGSRAAPWSRTTAPTATSPGRRPFREGTYWISLAQPQKHWVQATLNEDTYVPFPYFYDVSGWSLPLLAGIKGGSTGLPVTAPVVKVPKLGHPHGTPLPSGTLPRIAVIDQWPEPWNGYQYCGWLKWRLGEDWRFPYTVLLPRTGHRQHAAEVRRRHRGQRRLRPGVRGPRGEGARCPRELGLPRRSLRRLAGGRPAGVEARDLPGGHGRTAGRVARGDDADPHPARAQRDRVGQRLQPRPRPRRCPGGRRIPPAHVRLRLRHRDPTLSPAPPLETVETFGSGSVTVFGYEPNFRAVADGSARLLREAILGTPTGSVPWTSRRRRPPSRLLGARSGSATARPRPHARGAWSTTRREGDAARGRSG